MTKDNTENLLCECCGNATAPEIAAKRGYALRKCLNCGLFFVWPQPSREELGFLYSRSQGYFGTAATDLAKTSGESALSLHKLLAERRLGKGMLLDIGCATGELIFHMKKLGYTVAGCDVSAEAVRIAIDNGLDAKVGDIETLQYQAESFDIINMGDVLEHVSSPHDTLRTAFSLLKPGGAIVIATPNSNSSFALSTLLLSRTTGFPWAHSEAPYHLFEFAPKSILELLVKAGFSASEVMTSGNASLMYTVGATGYFDDLKRELKSSGRYKIRISVIPYIAKLFAIAGLLLPFYIFSRIANSMRNSGQVITAIARRIESNDLQSFRQSQSATNMRISDMNLSTENILARCARSACSARCRSGLSNNATIFATASS